VQRIGVAEASQSKIIAKLLEQVSGARIETLRPGYKLRKELVRTKQELPLVYESTGEFCRLEVAELQLSHHTRRKPVGRNIGPFEGHRYERGQSLRPGVVHQDATKIEEENARGGH
jgi:hypothetical protein